MARRGESLHTQRCITLAVVAIISLLFPSTANAGTGRRTWHSGPVAHVDDSTVETLKTQDMNGIHGQSNTITGPSGTSINPTQTVVPNLESASNLNINGQSLRVNGVLTQGGVTLESPTSSRINIKGKAHLTGDLDVNRTPMIGTTSFTRDDDHCATSATGTMGTATRSLYDDGRTHLQVGSGCADTTLSNIQAGGVISNTAVTSDGTLSLDGSTGVRIQKSGAISVRTTATGIATTNLQVDGDLNFGGDLVVDGPDPLHLSPGGVDVVTVDTDVQFKKMLYLPDQTVARPACNAGNRGVLWMTYGGAGVADKLEICEANLGGIFVWEVFAPDVKGPTGPVGDKGQKGQKGIKGVKGQKGQTGPIGAKGLKGTKGQKGQKGVNGPTGDKGNTGAKGNPGTKGNKGAAGTAGPTGPQGAKGTKGTAATTSTSCAVGAITNPAMVGFTGGALDADEHGVKWTTGCYSAALARVAANYLWTYGHFVTPCRAGYTALLAGKICMSNSMYYVNNQPNSITQANQGCHAQNAVVCPTRAFHAACANHVITKSDGSTLTFGNYNPYAGHGLGAYGDLVQDDRQATWNAGNCNSNNDGGSVSKWDQWNINMGYRCCYGQMSM